jgi:transposase-like protein
MRAGGPRRPRRWPFNSAEVDFVMRGFQSVCLASMKPTAGVRTKSWTHCEGRESVYSREDRIKAVKLYIKYDFSVAEVRRELGYPAGYGTLRQWYQDYLEEQETGIIKEPNTKIRTYTDEQKRIAVEHYLSHGRSLARTMRLLGYPSKPVFGKCETNHAEA